MYLDKKFEKLFLEVSKRAALSLLITFAFVFLFFLSSDNCLASSSFLVTKNSAPAKAELFMPKISTGIDGSASFTVLPS